MLLRSSVARLATALSAPFMSHVLLFPLSLHHVLYPCLCFPLLLRGAHRRSDSGIAASKSAGGAGGEARACSARGVGGRWGSWTARAGNRRFCLLSALRAIQKRHRKQIYCGKH
jgi:hypothetical protein